AVVAEEVRNLAARSSKAAKETAALIENSVEKTRNGSAIASETAAKLHTFIDAISRVTVLVEEIASASNEQALGISQVNQGLSQIDQVTQRNTANAEQSAAASEELSGQAAGLQRLLARFTLGTRESSQVQQLAITRQNNDQTEYSSKPDSNEGLDLKDMDRYRTISLDDREFGKDGQRETEI
ncbi:MAG: methyl-accepting chemotaxis protein, partial [Desulfobulbales bacterium]|nr:methyl-accepting chemotaxis protein [Desulfobulbales bacterium]